MLIVGCGLGFAVVLSQAGDRTAVLAMGHPVAKGQVVERGDLVSRSVAGVPGAIGLDAIDDVAGKTAAVDLVAGQILTGDMVTAEAVPGPDHAVVGLSLEPSQVPSAGLDAGDVVAVLAVPAKGVDDPEAMEVPAVLAQSAQVYAVAGAPTEGGTVLVTLLVDRREANRVAAYATSNRVAVIETSQTDGGAAP